MSMLISYVRNTVLPHLIPHLVLLFFCSSEERACNITQDFYFLTLALILILFLNFPLVAFVLFRPCRYYFYTHKYHTAYKNVDVFVDSVRTVQTVRGLPMRSFLDIVRPLIIQQDHLFISKMSPSHCQS